ncbi:MULTISPECIES: hypothetical protein [Heyndrickxia]|uniref:hypothetical protein n=1 Tax=Heyndrickxia TaxID=2837504 RepID=UPI000D381E70|nr:hypothetical protein [Heyndrickxia sporothermodurans]PTY77848.1 hypothetical protein B5V89_12740 [Heyndrickxia sporothermodurans]
MNKNHQSQSARKRHMQELEQEPSIPKYPKGRIKAIEHQNSVTSVYKPNNDGASHTLWLSVCNLV